MLTIKLKSLRKSRNLTQNDVAIMLGISRVRYSNYETGKRSPDYETLQQLADLFEVTIDYLLGRSNNPIKYLTHEDNSIDEDLEDVVQRLEANSDHLIFKGQPLTDATKEALLISLRNTLELAEKIAEMAKKYN